MGDEKREVVVRDVKIPFWSMVMLMVKWAIAAIPALIILVLIVALVCTALATIFGGGNYHWEWHRWWGGRGV